MTHSRLKGLTDLYSVNAIIAEHLCDQDIASFARACHGTRNAIYSDRSPIWRAKFTQHFDLVPGTNNNSLRSTYQHRRKCLRRGAKFGQGKSILEKRCLHVLKDLIVESFASGHVIRDAEGDITSKNIQALETFAKDTNLLSYICSYKQDIHDPLLTAIQIALSHLRFTPTIPTRAFSFGVTQKAMYATATEEPIFKGQNKIDVNLNWVLYAVNFFKYHFTTSENQELSNDYDSLTPFEKIKVWRRPLTDGAHALGKRWKGAYAYLEHNDVERIRQSNHTQISHIANDFDDVFIDNFYGSEDRDRTFQTLRLDFSQRMTARGWPKPFESHLRSLSHPSATYLSGVQKSSKAANGRGRTTRAQHRSEAPVTAFTENSPPPSKIDPKPLSFSFQGSGKDGEKFFAAGWLNPLPPQQGIPGFMRWTMMKFYVQDPDSEGEGETEDPFAMKGYGTANPFAYMDVDSWWAYEGVVLPGGEIVVGRWWNPLSSVDDEDQDEEMYSGPFIFWCVDGKPVMS